MTQENLVNVKRMKHLFLIFLKQFEVDEYKLLIQFLQLIINKYNSNPSTLFGFLTNQKEDEDEFLASNSCNRRMYHINPKLYYHQRNGRNTRRAETESSLDRNSEISKSSVKSLDDQLDEDNFKYDDNDDDTDIEYLDENYNEPLGDGQLMTNSEYDMDMLKGRKDILDSFVMKNRISNDESNDHENSAADSELNNQAEEFDQENYNTEAGEQYYDNQEYAEQFENEDGEFYDEQYPKQLNQHKYSNKQGYYQKTPENYDMQCYDQEETLDDTNYEEGQHNYSQPTPTTSQYDTSQLDSKSRVRKFSDAIRNQLERKFLANNFISGVEKSELAKKLSLTERQVQKWFVHRREKLRRLEKKNGTAPCQPPQPRMLALQQTTQQNQIKKTIDQFKGPISPGRFTNKRKHDSLENSSNPYQKIYLTRKPLDRPPMKNDESLSNKELDEENEFDETNLSNQDTVNYENDDLNYENSDDFEYQIDENAADYEDFKENKDYLLSDEDDTNPDQETDNYGKQTTSMNRHQFLLEKQKQDERDYYQSQQTRSLEKSQEAKRKCLTVPRRLFPPHVVTHLESLFDTEKYLKETQIEEIAKVTNLNEKQIRSWFKQRRFRYNLENKEKGIEKDYAINQRTNLPRDVVNELEKAFQKNNYVYGNDKKNLSRQLNLKPIQLERWFYYRRKKLSTEASNVEGFDMS